MGLPLKDHPIMCKTLKLLQRERRCGQRVVYQQHTCCTHSIHGDYYGMHHVLCVTSLSPELHKYNRFHMTTPTR